MAESNSPGTNNYNCVGNNTDDYCHSHVSSSNHGYGNIDTDNHAHSNVYSDGHGYNRINTNIYRFTHLSSNNYGYSNIDTDTKLITAYELGAYNRHNRCLGDYRCNDIVCIAAETQIEKTTIS